MFHFRQRTNKTSYDPYDCLTTSHIPCNTFTSDDDSSQFMNQDEYWSNGTTVQFFNHSSSSHNTSDSNWTRTHLERQHTQNDNKRMMRTMDPSTNMAPIGYEQQNTNARMNQKKRLHNDHEVRNSILAGSIAGIVSCSIFHPLDVVRTKMQASTKLVGNATNQTMVTTSTAITSKTTQVLGNGINATSGPLAVISHTYRNGGLRAFYTGLGLPLAAQAVYKSTIFTTNRIATGILIEWRTKERRKTGIYTEYKLTSFDHFLCGSISGAVNALLFVSPVEYVRNQLIQHHTNKAEHDLSRKTTMKGPYDVIKKTLTTEGVLGLWRGAGVTLVRDSVGCGAFFIMNDFGQKYISNAGYDEDSLVTKLGSGFLAGFGYWFVSLPLDALKTLVQTGKASSAVDTLHILIERDGVLGATRQLYRGWQLAFGRGSPSAAVTLTTYSLAYSFCEKKLV